MTKMQKKKKKKLKHEKIMSKKIFFKKKKKNHKSILKNEKSKGKGKGKVKVKVKCFFLIEIFPKKKNLKNNFFNKTIFTLIFDQNAINEKK